MVAYFLVPVTLWVLPSSFFDTGTSLSLFEFVGVKDYISKGITRACMHLIHFEFETAWSYNKLAFIVMPMISFLWFQGAWVEMFKLRRKYFANHFISIKIENKIKDVDQLRKADYFLVNKRF